MVQKTALDLLAAQSDMTTEDFYNLMVSLGLSSTELDKLKTNTGISATTISDLAYATGLSTDKIYEMIVSAAGSKSALDLLAAQSDMTTEDFYNLMVSLGLSSTELDKLKTNTGISVGTLAELAAQTGLTTDDIAAMAVDYNAVMRAMAEATGKAVTNVLNMSDSDYQKYVENKRLAELIYANTGIWDTRLAASNQALREQYGIQTDNMTYMDLILAGYKTIAQDVQASVADGGIKIYGLFSWVEKAVDSIQDAIAEARRIAGSKNSGGGGGSSSSTSGATVGAVLGSALGPVGKVVGAAVGSALGKLFGFASGGVNDFTGPAMLHGTKAASETIFNASDSKKLYDLVHGTPDLADKLARDVARLMATRVPTQSQVKPLIQIYNQPNGGIPTQVSKQEQVEPTNYDAISQRILENVLPAVFNVMNSPTNNTQDKTPLYVNTLIADKQGLTELERRLYDIRVIDQTRR